VAGYAAQEHSRAISKKFSGSTRALTHPPSARDERLPRDVHLPVLAHLLLAFLLLLQKFFTRDVAVMDGFFARAKRRGERE
jgi:hypothetical protein